MSTSFYIWMAVALGFLIIELTTPTMVFICFTAGAGAAGVYAEFYPDSYWIQGAIFAVVSVALIPMMRRFAGKITKPAPQRSNVDRLIGEVAIVTQQIEPDLPGRIRFESEVWAAMADETIPVNTRVKVISVSGTKAKVERATQ